MVTFKLEERNNDKLIYFYYPEGHEDKRPGTIIADLAKNKITVTELAEEDRIIPPKELNGLAKAINMIKRGNGESDPVELVTWPERSFFTEITQSGRSLSVSIREMYPKKLCGRGTEAAYS